jgi:SAM-dependent methyltransferase
MTSFYKAFEDRFRGSRELIAERLKIYLPLIQPLKNTYPDCNAVDLGCGRGEWLELLNSNGFKSHGVDIDEGMLENANLLGLSTELKDALEHLTSLPDESIHLISGFHIAEHLPFDILQKLVQESLRVLKPAGLLILETPNPENISVGSNTFYIDPTHVRPLPPPLLSFLPEYFGFARVTVFRLNSSLPINNEISLLNVISDVSPDYSVIAQKNGPLELLALFDVEFNKKLGFTLNELSEKYEEARSNRQALENHISVLALNQRQLIDNLESHKSHVEQKYIAIESSLTEQLNAMGVKSSESAYALRQKIQEHETRLHKAQEDGAQRDISIMAHSAEVLGETRAVVQEHVERLAEQEQEQEQAMKAEFLVLRDMLSQVESSAIERENALSDQALRLRNDFLALERELTASLIRKGEVCQALKIQLTNLDRQFANARALEVALRAQVAQLTASSLSLGQKIKNIEESIYWKLTAPIRKAVTFFTKQKK